MAVTPQDLAHTVSELAPSATLPVEASVEVRNRFDGRWCAGYLVDQVDVYDALLRYRVRRRAGGAPLPGWFDPDEIRGAPR